MGEEDGLPVLATLLRQYRDRLGRSLGRTVSQYELAERTRPGPTDRPIVSSSTIGMIEMGRRGATLQKVDALAVALELTEEEHRKLRVAAGHDDQGAIGALGLVRRLDTVEEALEAVNSRLDDLENHLDDLDRRLP